MQTQIVLSDAAINYITKILTKENGVGFRISIKKTGCSGYSYEPSIAKEICSQDLEMTISGIRIFIDTKWQHLLQELHIDYIEENKSGLNQKRLVFTNPKESSRCGCGESFHVE